MLSQKSPPPPLPGNPAAIEQDPWFPHTRQLLKVKEVAEALVVSPQQIRDLLEEGWLMGLDISNGVKQQRMHLRIQRFSVVAYLLNKAEDRGEPVPIKETPHVAWFRAELRKRRKVHATAAKIYP